MKHIHNSLIICAALAAVPFAAGASVEAHGSAAATAAYVSSMPLADSPQADILVKGRVIDEDNNPLAGVSVIVQGTTRGTLTDVDGNFELNAPEDAVLAFSYKGYYPQQVDVSGNASLGDIVLTKDMNAGLVNLAFRKVSEDDLVGSVSYVNMEEKMEYNYTSTRVIDNMISYVSGLTGDPNNAFSTIWGMNPDNLNYMVVIDGCPRGLAGHENLLST